MQNSAARQYTHLDAIMGVSHTVASNVVGVTKRRKRCKIDKVLVLGKFSSLCSLASFILSARLTGGGLSRLLFWRNLSYVRQPSYPVVRMEIWRQGIGQFKVGP